MGDVDLWSLEGEPGKRTLTVNAKWLQHLQERLLGDDGHPRKVSSCPHHLHARLAQEFVLGEDGHPRKVRSCSSVALEACGAECLYSPPMVRLHTRSTDAWCRRLCPWFGRSGKRCVRCIDQCFFRYTTAGNVCGGKTRFSSKRHTSPMACSHGSSGGGCACPTGLRTLLHAPGSGRGRHLSGLDGRPRRLL